MSLATNAALYRAVAKLLTSWGWPVETPPDSLRAAVAWAA